MRRRCAALVRRLRRDEGGYSLVELIISMSILAAVMTSISVLLVSATNSEVDMNKRFQAQTNARLGLDKMRREIHCASAVTLSGTPVSGLYPTAVLTIPSTCPTAAGLTAITWCTRTVSGRQELWRYANGACSGTGRKWAGDLTKGTIFSYTAQSTTSLAKLHVELPVNPTPASPERVYQLDDDIVLRNSTRT